MPVYTKVLFKDWKKHGKFWTKNTSLLSMHWWKSWTIKTISKTIANSLQNDQKLNQWLDIWVSSSSFFFQRLLLGFIFQSKLWTIFDKVSLQKIWHSWRKEILTKIKICIISTNSEWLVIRSLKSFDGRRQNTIYCRSKKFKLVKIFTI